MPSLSSVKRTNLINIIFSKLDNDYSELNEWEQGFLEDMMNKLSNGYDLSQKQFDKLTDIVGFDYLK